MTTRAETYQHYLDVCQVHKKEASDLIRAIFEQLRQTEPDRKYVYEKRY